MNEEETRKIWESFENFSAHWERAFRTTEEEYSIIKMLFDETEEVIQEMKQQEEEKMREMSKNPRFSEELRKAQLAAEHADKVDRPAGYYTAATIYRRLGLLNKSQEYYGVAASIAMDRGCNWRNHLLSQEEVRRIIKLKALTNLSNRNQRSFYGGDLIKIFFNELSEEDKKMVMATVRFHSREDI